MDKKKTLGIGKDRGLYQKGLKYIKLNNSIDSTITSILTAIKLTANNNQNQKKKTIVISARSFISKTNKKIQIINKNKVLKSRAITLLDKYTMRCDRKEVQTTNLLSNKNHTNANTVGTINTIAFNTIMKRLEVIINNYDIIIIDGIKEYIDLLPTDINNAENNTLNPYDENIKLFLQSIQEIEKKNSKNIICIENEERIHKVASETISKDEMYRLTYQKENSDNVYIHKDNDKNYTSSQRYININHDIIMQSLKEEKKELPFLIEKENIITLKNVSNANIRQYPKYKTGFNELDILLNGGFELGQVVSLVTDEEHIASMFLTKLISQSQSYFNLMYINLYSSHTDIKDLISFANAKRENDNMDKVEILTMQSLEKDGDISELKEKIEHSITNRDTRVVVIDSDIYLSDEKSQNNSIEADGIYKQLQIIASKHNALIIIASIKNLSDKELEKDNTKPIVIDNSKKAIHWIKTQIMITSSQMKITKLYTPIREILSSNNTGTSIGTNTLPLIENVINQEPKSTV